MLKNKIIIEKKEVRTSLPQSVKPEVKAGSLPSKIVPDPSLQPQKEAVTHPSQEQIPVSKDIPPTKVKNKEKPISPKPTSVPPTSLNGHSFSLGKEKSEESSSAKIPFQEKKKNLANLPVSPSQKKKKYLFSGSSPTGQPLSAKDKLYQEILASSQKENLDRQAFIARIEGETQLRSSSNLNQEKGKVVFQPVPQKPTRAQKIVTRSLIVLLLISLGFLIYLIIRGYLI